MFARRHPFLFFILIFSAICAGSVIALSLIFSSDRDVVHGDKVGIIEVTGMISTSREIVADIKRFRENESIKAIVLRVDSPGGGVGPSQEIFRELRKTVVEKKVYTSMGSVAASGGYYIAAATDGIIANPGTITGSIGVIMGYTNIKEIMDKIGLVPVVVKSGKFKDIGSPVREMSDAERNLLQELVDRIHSQFVNDVAEGRNIEIDKMKTLADGRVYTGDMAMEAGLVDRLGNLEDAVEWAGREAGIEGKIQTIYSRKEKFTILEYLLGASLSELFEESMRSKISGGFIYSPDPAS
ncbi:MAG: signal peptide peptidase SppA [Desulfobacterales bacterium]|nr:signal peptide peptidase SppA [Desulfobacterales bacterium]